jgi:DNA-directed RNA polymerase sigma subunit (sigma70/sigma32)
MVAVDIPHQTSGGTMTGREHTAVSAAHDTIDSGAQPHRSLATLTEQEAVVLRLRYGQSGGVATSQVVAGQIGLPEHTVRRIERDALRKLRMYAVGLVEYGFNGWDEV